MIDTGQNDSSLLNPHFVEDSKYYFGLTPI